MTADVADIAVSTAHFGMGREGGTWSFDFFCDLKNIATLKGSFARGERR